jgi:cell division ATPase FtsA
MVDSSKKTLEPVGMKGREMTAFISFVVGNRYFIDDVTTRMAELGIQVSGFFSTTAGEAMLYLDEQARDHTSVLIDMGYLNTEIIGVEGDAVIYHKVLPLGGSDITVALVDELDISLPAAEEIKRKFVYGIDSGDDKYEVPGADGEKAAVFTRDQVKPVICKAVDEIAAEIKDAIDNDFGGLGNWSHVLMTGGGLSFNRGGREYLGGRLGRAVEDIPRRTTKLNSHSFSSSLGLMDLIIDTIEQQRAPSGGFGSKVAGFFKSLLGG